MGTNHAGELKVLSDMAKPDVAVITNCGAEHLEGLGDLMGVRLENATIISGLHPKGLLVVNGDEPELLEAVKDYPGQRITFGFKETNDLFATDIECSEAGVRFRLNGSARREVFVPLLGRHTASNALAAIAVGRKLRVSEDRVIDSLANAHGADMRLQMHKANGLTVLNDAYNANPNSMRAALDTVTALPSGDYDRRVAVLGDMREMGAASERYHREIGDLAGRCGFALLACIGQDARWLADAAEAAGMKPETVLRFPDSASAAEHVPALVKPGDLVLVKASRGIKLEAVANALIADPNRDGAGARKAAS
jgi:UDP-N-acetylmuramoyl-tripeptide--D-alanyl-D-alanine ligase